MEVDLAKRSWSAVTGRNIGECREGPYQLRVQVGDKSSYAFADSGCAQTLIRQALLEGVTWEPQGKVAISCIHGETRVYPTTKVKLTVDGYSAYVKVAVAQCLPYPVLLGRDWPFLIVF